MNDKIKKRIEKLSSDEAFLQTVPDIMAAARAALNLGAMRGDEKLIEFNTLVLRFLSALEAARDEGMDRAVEEAEALIRAGHGRAFGME